VSSLYRLFATIQAKCVKRGGLYWTKDSLVWGILALLTYRESCCNGVFVMGMDMDMDIDMDMDMDMDIDMDMDMDMDGNSYTFGGDGLEDWKLVTGSAVILETPHGPFRSGTVYDSINQSIMRGKGFYTGYRVG